jgi:predicted HTH domain antitoxin
MPAVNLQLPGDVVFEAKLNEGDVSREAAKIIAMELFRERKVSLGRASELCDAPLAALMDFVASHGVPRIDYDLDELEADRRTIARLRA